MQYDVEKGEICKFYTQSAGHIFLTNFILAGGVLLAGGRYEAGSGKKRHLHVWNAPGVQAAARSPLASMVVHGSRG